MSLPRYAEYKDSGVAWLGEVPSHWHVVPLKHLVTLRSGGTPNKEKLEYWDGTVPWASAKDLKSEMLSNTEDHLCDLAVESGVATLLPTSAVLVVVRGMILARTFPVAQILVPMAINQDLKALLPKSGVESPFLACLLRASARESLQRLDEAGHGTKALRMDAWTSMPLPLPPEHEQRSIASVLDRETAKIDALIAEQEKLLALLAEKRQATISHAVTRGLDPNVRMKDSGIPWLGEVPAHWEVTMLRRSVAGFEQGWSPECDSRPAEEGEWGVLKAGCVNGGEFKASENKALPQSLVARPELEVKPGDVLMSRASGSPKLIGSVAFVDHPPARLMLSDKVYRLRLSSRVVPRFFAMLMGSVSLRQQIEQAIGGAEGLANNLPQASIKEFWIALPPEPEQQQIFAYVSTKLESFHELSLATERARELLKERRSVLISAAVTGKIDVRGLVQEAQAA